MVNNDISNRLLVYGFLDKDGIVDNYVLYQLRELKQHVSYIIFAVAGKLSNKSKKKLINLVDEIKVYDDVTFIKDLYRQVLSQLDKHRFLKFEELIISNNDMYGPIFPISKVFDHFKNSDVDFWGISRHYSWEENNIPVNSFVEMPEHIQDYFLVIKKSVIHSEMFLSYWQNEETISDTHHLTQFLEANGFRSDVHVHTDFWRNVCVAPLWFEASELIIENQIPYFDRRVFINDNYKNITSCTFGEQVQKILQFIREETNYDEKLIWENALRCTNMSDLHNNARLINVLSDRILSHKEHKRKILLVIHAYYSDCVSFVLRYIRRFPRHGDVLIVTPSEEVKLQYDLEIKNSNIPNHVIINLIPNRGRDVSGLLVGAKPYVDQYDLVFFVHDKKTTHVSPRSIGYSWQKKCFENLLCSEIYVQNIVNLFEQEKCLGMAFPPPPYNVANHYRYLVGWEWSDSFIASKQLLEQFKTRSEYTEDKPPIAPFGTMFVFRPRALKKLFNGPKKNGWSYDDFPKEPIENDGTMLHGLERAYPFFVQDEGYYVSWILNESWAANEISNYLTGWTEARKMIKPLFFGW